MCAAYVHELAREGKLKLGARGRLFGTIWFEVTGGPDARQLVLAPPASHRAANRWSPFSRLFAAIGGKHISAGVTSCSCATNAMAKGASCMRGMGTPALGFSAAANALASPISPPWAIGGIARRVVSRSCALGSNGAHTAPCRSNREVCMSGRTSASWGCLPTTRPYEIRVQATLEKPDQISTMPTCGDNAETDLRVLAGGRIAEPQLQSGHAERRNQCRYRG